MNATSVSLCVLSLLPSLAGQAWVRVHDQVVAPRAGSGAPAVGPLAGPTACATLPMALYGQAVPGGGTLALIAFANPASVNRNGRMAFVADVSGTSRNQGVLRRAVLLVPAGAGTKPRTS